MLPKAEFADVCKTALFLGGTFLLYAAPQFTLAGPMIPTAAAAVTTTRSAVRPRRPPVTPLDLSSSLRTVSPNHYSTVFAEHGGLVHFESLREVGAASSRGGTPSAAFPVKWQNNPANLSPEVVSLVRNFHHNGLPILRLWGSGRNLLAVGVNPHGVPGVYFTQRMD